MSFVEAASAEILKTLLSVFFLRRTLTEPQVTREAMVRGAHRFALALEAGKTDNDSVNQTAIQVTAGLLLAFYQNRPANKNWSRMVHGRKTPRFVRDAYAIAGMMSDQINQAPTDAGTGTKEIPQASNDQGSSTTSPRCVQSIAIPSRHWPVAE